MGIKGLTYFKPERAGDIFLVRWVNVDRKGEIIVDINTKRFAGLNSLYRIITTLILRGKVSFAAFYLEQTNTNSVLTTYKLNLLGYV